MASDAPAPTALLPLAERVAQLEERTAPKKKGWVDHIKEWGGVATVLIAILYTFPTGVWQQYFQPEQKAADDLRSVIDQTTMILADAVKATSSAKDDQTAMQLNRFYTTRAYALMARHTRAFEKYADKLTPSELLIVGSTYGQVNMTTLSIRFLDLAMNSSRGTDKDGKVSVTDTMTYLTAARSKAATLFAPGPRQDLRAARNLFRVVTMEAAGATSPMEGLALVDLKGNWAWMELTFGDYACGQALLREAQHLYENLGLFLIDSGKMRTLFDYMAKAAPRPGQSSGGCQS